MDAKVVCVVGHNLVNLSVADHGGTVHSIRSVPLVQDMGLAPQGMYCEWPSYHSGQAAKQPEPVLFPIDRKTAETIVRIIQKIEAQIDKHD